jgi:cysteine sulfinate desulfinase/cysteine desulfurase-like protein
MGLTEDEAHCSVRFSLGRQNTEEEIKRTVKAVEIIKKEMKDKIRFVSCR